MISFHKYLEKVRHLNYNKFQNLKQAERSRIYNAYLEYVNQAVSVKKPSRRGLKTR